MAGIRIFQVAGVVFVVHSASNKEIVFIALEMQPKFADAAVKTLKPQNGSKKTNFMAHDDGGTDTVVKMISTLHNQNHRDLRGKHNIPSSSSRAAAVMKNF